MKICSIGGCGKKCLAKGLCNSHYQKFKKYGDPEHKQPVLRCSIPGCNTEHSALNLCSSHYQKFKRYGDPEYVPPPFIDPGCKVPGCEGGHESRGLCGKHYQALRTHGSPEGSPQMVARKYGLKICSKCKIPKTFECFHRSADSKDGLYSSCQACEARNKNSPEKSRNACLLHRFGITVEDYDVWLVAQGGVCAICKQPEPHTNKRLSVDHNHLTKKVRGLLCSFCNQGIGMFKDSRSNLSAAIEYLKRSDGGLE